MKRTFIELPLFRSKWKDLGLNEKDNLSNEERNEIRKLITVLENQLNDNF